MPSLKRPSDRPLILPQGELKRFRLPEVLDAPEALRRSRFRWLWSLVGAWLVVSWIGFQLSLGRWLPAQWLALPSTGAPATAVGEGLPGGPQLLGKGDTQKGGAAPAPDGSQFAAFSGPPSAIAPSSVPLSLPHRVDLSPARETYHAPETVEDGVVVNDSHRGIAHWYPSGVRPAGLEGCAAAAAFYETPSSTVQAGQELVPLLERRTAYRGCKVAAPAAVSVCVTVVGRRAKGVTVQSEPPSLYLSGCVAAAISRMTFPPGARLRRARAEIFWD